MKNKLYILEGPDCVGKTTLALALAKALGSPVLHLTCTSKLAPGMVDYHLNAIENAKTNMDLHGKGFVLDRHWPSEACYGAHFRGITISDLQESIAAADKLEPVYIFCMDPYGVESAAARHRENQDPAHPYKDDDFKIIYRNYEVLIKYLQFQEDDGNFFVVHYDDSPNWEESLARKVQQILLD